MHSYEFVRLLPLLLPVLLSAFAVVMAWCYLRVTDEPWLGMTDVPDNCDGLTVKGLLFYLDVRSQTKPEKRKTAAALDLPAPEPEPVVWAELRQSMLDNPATIPGEGGPMPVPQTLSYQEACDIVEQAMDSALLELIHASTSRWKSVGIEHIEWLGAEVEARARFDALKDTSNQLRDLSSLPNAPPLAFTMPDGTPIHVRQDAAPRGWACIEGGLST